MGHCIFNSWREGTREDGRSVARFNEIFYQIKIAILTTGVVKQLAPFLLLD